MRTLIFDINTLFTPFVSRPDDEEYLDCGEETFSCVNPTVSVVLSENINPVWLELGLLKIKILAEKDKDSALVHYKLNGKTYFFSAEKIVSCLNQYRPGLISTEDIIFYEEGSSDGADIFNFDNSLGETVFLSNDASLIKSAKSCDIETARCYQEAEIDLRMLDLLPESPEGKVRIYVDIDFTLLDSVKTITNKETILNQTVIQVLLSLKEKYPDTEFTIITSRVKTDYEVKEDEWGSAASVIQALREKTQIDISMEGVIFTGEFKHNGVNNTVEHIIRKRKADIIIEREQEFSEPAGLIVFLDDNYDELVRANKKRKEVHSEGLSFDLWPIAVQRGGNLTWAARQKLSECFSKLREEIVQASPSTPDDQMSSQVATNEAGTTPSFGM